MSKKDNAYIRSLLTERLKYSIRFMDLNLYLTIYKGKILKFKLFIDKDIKAIFTEESYEFFKRIDYKEVSDYLKSNDFHMKDRDFLIQFDKDYKYIQTLLDLDRNNPLELQQICKILRGSYDRSLTTLSFNAYEQFKFDTNELKLLNPIFEKKLNENNITGLIKINELGDIMYEKWRNIIYFGPPGTGKSTEIKNAAESILKIGNGNLDRVIRVTFHPEYSYYDFVGQYKPVVGLETVTNSIELINKSIFSNSFQKGSTPTTKKPFVYYDFVPGPFTMSLIKALNSNSKDPTKKNVLLILEEINRGNCAAIFGDLFQLLDRNEDGESTYELQLPIEMRNFIINSLDDFSIEQWNKKYENGFKLPKNLYIYASMNTSDESVFPIDSAFKRRWNMIYVPIEYDNIELNDIYLPKPLDNIQWLTFIEVINEEIVKRHRNEDKQIGQWFINKNSSDEKIFVYKVLSYLWFNVLDRNHSTIFDEIIYSYEKLVSIAASGIDRVFNKNLLNTIKEKQENKINKKADL